MSKRKQREREEEGSLPAENVPAKEEVIIADPPRPNATFLTVSAILYAVWLAFLVWMAMPR